MNQLTILIALLLGWTHALAQDVIMRTDRSEITAKVIEITTDEVKYKPFSRLDGPLYTLKKSDIFVIIYHDGTREKFGSPPSGSRPALTPEPATSPVSAAPASVASSGSRSGWLFGLGYTTPSAAVGEASGIALHSGYYFLGKSRKAGGLIDIDGLYYFGDVAPTYYLLALNGVARFSETSTFYVGGGLGYASLSVDVPQYDRFGIRTTQKVTSGDIGGKFFVGYGLFRLGLTLPSFQSTDGGGLLTVSLVTNPF